MKKVYLKFLCICLVSLLLVGSFASCSFLGKDETPNEVSTDYNAEASTSFALGGLNSIISSPDFYVQTIDINYMLFQSGFLKYSYNSAGNLISCVWTDMGLNPIYELFSYRHVYTAEGKVERIEVCVEGESSTLAPLYDANGRVMEASNGEIKMSFDWNEAGAMVKEEWQNSVGERLYAMTYNDQGRVAKQGEGLYIEGLFEFSYAENAIIATYGELSYHFSLSDGKIVSARETSIGSEQTLGTIEWTYGANGSCMRVKGDEAGVQMIYEYGYDASGNRVKEKGTMDDRGTTQHKIVMERTYNTLGNTSGYEAWGYKYENDVTQPNLVSHQKWDAYGNLILN